MKLGFFGVEQESSESSNCIIRLTCEKVWPWEGANEHLWNLIKEILDACAVARKNIFIIIGALQPAKDFIWKELFCSRKFVQIE